MAIVERKAHPRELDTGKVVPVRETVYEDGRVVLSEDQKLKHNAMKSATLDMATMVDDAVKRKPKAIVALRQSVEGLDVFLAHQDNPSPETYQAVLGTVGRIRKSMEALAPGVAKLPPGYQSHIIKQMRRLDQIMSETVLGERLEQPLAIQEIDDETYDKEADKLIAAVKEAKEIVADCDEVLGEISGKVHEKAKPSRFLRFLRGKSPFVAGLYSMARYGMYFMRGLMGRTAPNNENDDDIGKPRTPKAEKPKLNSI